MKTKALISFAVTVKLICACRYVGFLIRWLIYNFTDWVVKTGCQKLNFVSSFETTFAVCAALLSVMILNTSFMHIKFYTRTPMKNSFFFSFFSIKHGYCYRRIHTTEATKYIIHRADDTPGTSNVQPCVIIYEPRH